MIRHKKDAGSEAAQYLSGVLSWIGRIVGTLLLIFLTTTAILAVIAVIFVNNNLNQGIDINLRDFQLNLTSFIYCQDENGEYYEMEQLAGIENRVWISYSEIPKHVEHAVVAIEDKRFYEHHGVDWKRTIGGFSALLTGKGSYGGSTITQQVIKNVTGNKEVTVQRKLKEIMMALQVEKDFSKKDVIELYLNTIYLSQGQYGIKAAANYYFGKEVKDLTIAEAACLVGITNLPSYYDPYLNPTNNDRRKQFILGEMEEQGYITDAEYDAAMAEVLVFKRDQAETDVTETKAVQSTYVDQVISDVGRALAAEMNVKVSVAQQSIYTSGYRIYASIDTEVQAVMDEVFGNESNYPVVKGLDKPQIAMTIVDPYTGAVLGMTGGRGDKTGALTLNRAVQRYSPGSAIKPLSVYAPAIEAGLTPYSPVLDAPIRLDSKGNMYPGNSTSSGYAGQISMMYAVQISNNAAAAQTLKTLGFETSYDFLTKNLGFSSIVHGEEINGTYFTDLDYGPLSMGGFTWGVSTREMAAGYAAFVNKGIYNAPRTFEYITDNYGKIIIDNRNKTGTPAMQEKTAWYMNTMLVNVVENGTGTKAKISNMPTAGKTGTTTNDQDRYWVGYTPYYVGAVWFGYDEPQEIRLVKTENPSVNMWKQVMSKLHADLPRKEFFTFENTVKVSYCVDSGMKAGKACAGDIRGSRVKTAEFAEEDAPTEVCTMHQWVTVDAENGHRATSACPSTKTIGVLTVTRGFPMKNVVLTDEKYVLQSAKTKLEDGLFGPSTSGMGAFNIKCTDDHTAVPEPDPTVTEPPDDTTTEPPDDTPTEPPDGTTTEPTPPPDDTPTEPPVDTPTEPPVTTE